MGIALPQRGKKWYGEPDKSVEDEYLRQAKAMGLDDMTASSSLEPLSERLWRRYGDRAFGLLDSIRHDPSKAELLITSADYIRCEIEYAAEREMITKLEDFLRRRSKISLVVRREDYIDSSGLKEACDNLFGAQSEEKLQEYLDATVPAAGSQQALAV